MFQLYDRTRRRITLALFFVLCVTPTLAVSGWCFSRRLPAHVRGEARFLGWQLGMKVALEDVHYPRPGLVRYEGLVLSDPETGNRVLSCRVVEARWTTSDALGTPPSEKAASEQAGGTKDRQPRQSRPLLVLTALEPAEVEAAALGEVEGLVERVLARRAGWPEANLQLKAHEVRVRSEAGPLVLVELDGRLVTGVTKESPGRPGLAEAVAELDFRPSDAGPGEKAAIRVTRVRRLSPAAGLDPAVEIVFDTGSAPLPCSLLAGSVEGLALLGPRSRFLGSVQAVQRPEGWSYRVQGRFSAVDLERVFADRFPPHRLSGLAQVTVKHAALAGGRLEEFRGQVHARDGSVTRSLIESAARSFGLTSGLRPSDPAEFSYDQLAAELALDARGLQVWGLADDRAAIVRDQEGSILSGTRYQPVLVPTIVRMLVPDADPAAGASSAGALLARRLPIPGALPSAESSPIIPVASRPGGEDARR